MFIESHGQLHLSTGEPRHCIYASRMGLNTIGEEWRLSCWM